jgi:phosphatidylinositol-3-phosphatase
MLPFFRAILALSLMLPVAGQGFFSGWTVPAQVARSTSAPAAGTPSSSAPPSVPGQLPAFGHVFIVVLENKEASTVLGSPAAPYFNQLASQYASASNYYAVAHPSLPNYLALTGGSTFGITTDCTSCNVQADNIATEVEQAGRSWKAYMESLPAPCYTGAYAPLYAKRHDPFMYYDNIRGDANQCQNVVPLTQLQADLQANAVPDLAWITPNTCSDMHDCRISSGDAWLQTWVPQILASSAWQDNGVLFVLFDEGQSRAGCCGNAAGGKVASLVISPLVKPGFVSATPYSHYSLLRTIEEAWGLPLLGKAGSSSTASMSDFFLTGK